VWWRAAWLRRCADSCELLAVARGRNKGGLGAGGDRLAFCHDGEDVGRELGGGRVIAANDVQLAILRCFLRQRKFVVDHVLHIPASPGARSKNSFALGGANA
jgi:hypothetical protein